MFMRIFNLPALQVLLFVLLAQAASYAQAKPVRALHLVANNMTVDDARRLIDKAEEAKFNTIILGLPWRSGVRLRSTPWIIAGSKTWSRDDLLAVVNYARKKNMEIVPQLPLLTHQELFLAPNFPELMFNHKTYDPRKVDVYRYIFPVIDELIDLIRPRAVHIGHDEVLGWRPGKNWLKQGEKLLPPELFVEDVVHLHTYLKNKGIETWMWGDMLVSPAEFPSMISKELHGIAPGYGKQLRDKLPREMVICDWHYSGESADFPSLSTLKREGFRVFGVTWRERNTTINFSRFAGMNGAEGMIASTWVVLNSEGKNTVNSWEEVERIISESGAVFSKDFPDAK
jgi:hypothetical protein